ncbi:hypothetical protein BDD12DRAFT_805540 [Trichophaea hybrida]|nr:hypothetical protein BDD12DRAFT_805540 [Trichophaea hybrida]
MTRLPDYIPSSDPAPPGYQYFDAVQLPRSTYAAGVVSPQTVSSGRNPSLSTRQGVEYIHGHHLPHGGGVQLEEGERLEGPVGYEEARHRHSKSKSRTKGKEGVYKVKTSWKVEVEVTEVFKEKRGQGKEKKEKKGRRRDKGEKEKEKNKREKKEKGKHRLFD